MNAQVAVMAVGPVGRRISIGLGPFVALVAVTSLTGGPPLTTG
jgi:hypothetical protein